MYIKYAFFVGLYHHFVIETLYITSVSAKNLVDLSYWRKNKFHFNTYCLIVSERDSMEFD
jgi:hypothetical protein